jgi:hypothetical protein
MKRTTLNFIIDAIAFAGVVFLATTGFLMKYALPPGSGQLVGRGTGAGAAQKPVTLLWGLTRHEWGDIHFWIAVGLMAALAVHLIRHWRWIVCVLQGRPREGSGARAAFGVVGLVGLIAVAIAPLLSPTTQVTRAQLVETSTDLAPQTIEASPTPAPQTTGAATRGDTGGSTTRSTVGSTKVVASPGEDIKGSMTLREVEQTTGVPVSYLSQQLGLPQDISADERLGRLRRRYGLEIETVREAVARYKTKQGAQ